MAKSTAWLQHHWCLYICWLIQFPMICCLAFAIFFAYSLDLTRPYGAEGNLVLGLCGALLVLYIYQVFFYFIHRLGAAQMLWIQMFDGAFVTYLGVCFWRLGLSFRWPPRTWAPIARIAWLSLPLVA
ncbi:hypothetical protein E4T48_04371 [Aureobasidium sp. EXF-10727]|nr:hypothetical protein E4T48_04371 [Aureobasidium sp. EXF-10727]